MTDRDLREILSVMPEMVTLLTVVFPFSIASLRSFIGRLKAATYYFLLETFFSWYFSKLILSLAS